MKRLPIVAAAIGLLLLASLAVSFLHPSPIDVARRYCSEQGLPREHLVLLEYRGSGNLVGRRETVEFQLQGANPARKVVVELRQPVYFVPWQVVQFRTEDQQ